MVFICPDLCSMMIRSACPVIPHFKDLLTPLSYLKGVNKLGSHTKHVRSSGSASYVVLLDAIRSRLSLHVFIFPDRDFFARETDEWPLEVLSLTCPKPRSRLRERKPSSLCLDGKSSAACQFMADARESHIDLFDVSTRCHPLGMVCPRLKIQGFAIRCRCVRIRSAAIAEHRRLGFGTRRQKRARCFEPRLRLDNTLLPTDLTCV